MEEKTLVEKLADQLLYRLPKVRKAHSFGLCGIELLDNGAVCLYHDGQKLRPFHSAAEAVDGRRIDTRTARFRGSESEEAAEGLKVVSLFEENGLRLRQELLLQKSGELTVQIFLSEKKRSTVRSRHLAPILAPYPDKDGHPLFLSLDQKMLLTPYDNDMWARYESTVPNPGKTSYDVTAIFDEETYEGLVIGSLDHDVWKNAISWSAHDARAFTAYCGAADAGTHDIMPHGAVCGEEVASARFVLLWASDIRDGMERYGALCARQVSPRPWDGGPIFGWNSFSALGMGLRLRHWEEAGDFIHDALPHFADEEGVSYINLDACFGMSHKEIRRIVDRLHSRGQKAGWYGAPCICMPVMEQLPIFGTLTDLKHLVLEDDKGRPLPAADGSRPLDVTHPLWEKYARAQIKNVLDLGFDYIKLDFLSHAAVEGVHHLKNCTGRMALHHAYKILEDEISKAGREVFVSLSIAPLFPYFLGNARRCCCDSFGHIEDTRYVLNALNFGWWQSGTLYRYNDPDHLALFHSVIDGRGETTEAEARSRYLSGVISGTLMILSDNYDRPEAKERSKALANNASVNALARIGRPFRPVELRSDTTSFYTLCHEGRYYAAIFNFAKEERTLSFRAVRGGLPEKGTATSLVDGRSFSYEKWLTVSLEGHDCAIFEIVKG